MFTHLIFDYDGTLVDSLSIYLLAFQQVFTELGINYSQYQIAENCFGVNDGASLLGVKDTKEFYKKVDNLISESIKTPPLFNGVKETLNTLYNKGLSLNIVSSSSKKSIKYSLQHSGILEYFNLIVSGEDVVNLKPDPQGILKVIDYYSKPKDSFLMVGDSKQDIIASKNAGIKSCLFYPEQSNIYYRYKDLVKKYNPDFVVREFASISNLM